jgi:hypothetical protein
MESAGSACRQTSLSMAGAELKKELSCAEHFSSVCVGMSAAARSNPYLMPIAAEKFGLSKHDGDSSATSSRVWGHSAKLRSSLIASRGNGS